MGNENSLPTSRHDRTKAPRSAKARRKFGEYNCARRCSSDSGESNSSSTKHSQQIPETFIAKARTYPPQQISQNENCCSKQKSRKAPIERQISRETFSEHNFKNGFLAPQMTYYGKENQRSYVERRRSKSLCSQQLRTDCLTVSATPEVNQGLVTPTSTRRSSNGIVQTLTRLRIQQSFKAAKPNMGQLILKRACSLRSEIRSFLSRLSNEKVDELANDFYNFLSECVENTDDAEMIKVISKNFGEHLAHLSASGFRPDYLTPIADAAIAECIKLDGGTHKRCETLAAWSQLITVMFTSVRDGYYEMMRRQRRISLPHFQAKLNINLKEKKKICT